MTSSPIFCGHPIGSQTKSTSMVAMQRASKRAGLTCHAIAGLPVPILLLARAGRLSRLHHRQSSTPVWRCQTCGAVRALQDQRMLPSMKLVSKVSGKASASTSHCSTRPLKASKALPSPVPVLLCKMRASNRSRVSSLIALLGRLRGWFSHLQ